MKEIMQGCALLVLLVLGLILFVAVACDDTETNDCHEYSNGKLVCDDGFEEGP